MTWYKASKFPIAHEPALSKQIRDEFGEIELSWGRFDTIAGKGGQLLQITRDQRVAVRRAADCGVVTALQPGQAIKVTTSGTGVATASLDLTVNTEEVNAVGDSDLFGFSGTELRFGPGFGPGFDHQADTEFKSVPFEDLRTSIEFVNPSAGTGLIATRDGRNIVFDLDLNALPVSNAIPDAAELAYYDFSENTYKKATVVEFKASLQIPHGGSDIDSLIAGEGMSGGATEGAATLHVDLNSLTVENEVVAADTIPFWNGTHNRRITRDNLKTSFDVPVYTFASELNETTEGIASTIATQFHTVANLGPQANADLFIVHTDDGLKKITRANLITSLTPTEGFDTLAGSNGISVDGSTLNLDINSITTDSDTIAATDFFAFSREGEVGKPTWKISHADLHRSFKVPTYTIGDGLNASGSTLRLSFDDWEEEETPGLTGYTVIEDVSVNSGSKLRLVRLQTIRNALNVPDAYDTYVDPTFTNGLLAPEGVVKLNPLALGTVNALADADQFLLTDGRVSFEDVKTLIDYPVKTADDGLEIVNKQLNFKASTIESVSEIDTTDYITIVTEAGVTCRITAQNFFNSIQSRIAKVPVILAINISGGNQQLIVTWTVDAKASAITGFQVEYRQTGTDQWIDANHEGTNQRIVIPNLLGETDYDVRVQPTNGIGTGEFVATAGTTLNVGPDAPELTLVRGNGYIDTSWTEPNDHGLDIQAYELEYRRLGSTGDWTPAAFTDINTRSWRIPNLINGVTYEVRVRAYTQAGAGAWDTESAKPATTPGTATPILAGGDEILATSWVLPSNGGERITGVDVEYRRVGDLEWIKDLDNVLATSHTIRDLQNGATYEVRLKFRNAVGEGVYGPKASAGLISAVPEELSSTNITSAAFRGNWEQTNGATTYVFRYRAKGTTSWTTVTTSNTYYDVPDLTRATSYEWEVASRNDAGDSDFTDTQEVKTLATAPDKGDAPTLVRGNQYINVSLVHPNNGGSPLTNIRIEWRTTPSQNAVRGFGRWQHKDIHPSRTTYQITGSTIRNGTLYEVRVRYDNLIGEAEYSDSSHARPATIPTLVLYNAASEGAMRGLIFAYEDIDWGGYDSSDLRFHQNLEIRVREGSTGDWKSFTAFDQTVDQITLTFLSRYTPRGHDNRINVVFLHGAGLKQNTLYTIEMHASNPVGRTSWKSITLRTLRDSEPAAPEFYRLYSSGRIRFTSLTIPALTQIGVSMPYQYLHGLTRCDLYITEENAGNVNNALVSESFDITGIVRGLLFYDRARDSDSEDDPDVVFNWNPVAERRYKAWARVANGQGNSAFVTQVFEALEPSTVN